MNNMIKRLTSMEVAVLVYSAITLIMICFYWDGLSNPWGMVCLRGITLGIMLVTNLIAHFCHLNGKDALWGGRLGTALRVLPYMVLLIWWYPETYDFCSQLPYKDHIFAGIDQTLFGCQPALEFDRLMPSAFWSEAFNMGYYAYYYLMAAVIVFYLIRRHQQFDKAIFCFISSFFIFYLIYEFLPVGGPQYYFKALSNLGYPADGSALPDIGYYFKTNTEMIVPEIKGIFSQLVIGAQEIGERPTAAFPSSHVGMSTVSMLLALSSGNRRLLWILMPFYLLLCCATVYIKAHYLIDSIAGFVTAVVLYFVMNKVYDKWRGQCK